MECLKTAAESRKPVTVEPLLHLIKLTTCAMTGAPDGASCLGAFRTVFVVMAGLSSDISIKPFPGVRSGVLLDALLIQKTMIKRLQVTTTKRNIGIHAAARTRFVVFLEACSRGRAILVTVVDLYVYCVVG